MKVCAKCKEEKPETRFYKRSGSDTLRPYCIDCTNAYSREYSQTQQRRSWKKKYRQREDVKKKTHEYNTSVEVKKKNRIRMRELRKDKKFLEAERKRNKKYHKKKREDNREEYNQYMREYRKTDNYNSWRSEYNKSPDIQKRRKERLKEFFSKNPEKHQEYGNRRRSRENNSPGSFTTKEWKSLCRQYNHRCARCGEKKKLTVDHVVPLSKGGSNYIDNIQPLCSSCNSSKGAKRKDYRNKKQFNLF